MDEVGFVHLTYGQRHLGVPVFSGILKIHLAGANGASFASGRFHPIPRSLSIVPTLTRDEAIGVASAMSGFARSVVHRCELVVVDPGWYGDPPIGAHLAFHVEIEDGSGADAEAYFVDALNGDVLDRWSLVCRAIDRRVYDAFGSTELPGGLIRAEGDPPNGDPEIDSVYDYLGDVHSFFQLGFGRDSYDGLGSPIIASTYYDFSQCPANPNAAWSFLRRQMYFCQGTTVDDVVAHEFTHGVTQFTANLIYQNQPGQMNESFSDIFGELVDLYNGGSAFVDVTGVTPWTAHPTGPGADLPNNQRTGLCSSIGNGYQDGRRWLIGENSAAWPGGLRDMWDPTCFGHPDRALSQFQGCSGLDAGGVHSGSGVLNHAFAIACDGKTFNGQTVVGIGPIKAGAIWYRALSVYLTVASDFEDAFIAINQAAADLVGFAPLDPRTGLSSGSTITAFDVEQVGKALVAVELNAKGGCGQSIPVLNSTPAPMCDSEQLIFEDEFETGAPGWSVANTATWQPYDWVLRGSLPFGRTGTAWYCDDPNRGDCSAQTSDEAVHSLISPSIVIPSGMDTISLSFTHFVETEPRFDGGNVSLRVNGGAWTLIPSIAFYLNPYNTSLFTTVTDNTNPLAGQLAFTGVGGEWGTSLVELGSLVSPCDVIQIRFDFGKDSCFGFTGWFVDDVRVFGCPGSADCDGNGVADEVDRALGLGDTYFLQQTRNKSSGTLSDADPHPSLGVNKAAEDFTLSRSARIESLRVWGAYTGNTPVPDDFTVNFYQSAGGIPGALVHSESGVATARAATGVTFLNIGEHIYDMTPASPVALGAGTYFVEIFNNTAGHPTTWVWERALFGWIPGSARVGQSCQTYCRDPNFNFSIDLVGRYDSSIPGDMNLDDMVNSGDISLFVDALLTGPSNNAALCAADIDRDGDADGADLPLFVACVLAGGCP